MNEPPTTEPVVDGGTGAAQDHRPSDPPPALQAEAARYGTGMLRRFGWFHWLLGLRTPLAKMRLDQASAERVAAAAARGPLVYVLLRSSNLDHLALNKVVEACGLPRSIWAQDVTQFFWQPVLDAWSGLFRRLAARLSGRAPPDPIRSGFLARALAHEAPVTLFLQPRRTLWRRLTGRLPADPLPALLEAQEQLDRPIQLVPIVVVWTRGLDRPPHPALRAILPSPERPGGLYRLWKLAWYAEDNFVQAGEPVDLRGFLRRVDEPQRRRRTLYVLLRRYLRREHRVVRGPRLPAPSDLRRMVLDAPPMRRLAAEEAQRTGASLERVRRRMNKEYDRIAAHMRWWVIRILDVLLRPLWTRVYSGVDAPEADMERIREAMRDGAAIVLPSHKSHFDYLLLAWVFYQHKLTLPHVVAGANLAIPGVAFFLRSAGGFFIKRSFEGERLHPPILARYMRELVHHGVPIEFYLEGGRTRSGKLLPPKVGVLGMIFESAALRPAGHRVTLLPVALAYEQVAEQRSYVRELGGQDKKREDLGQLAKATQVVRRRLGRVYLRVGTPIDVAPLVDADPVQRLPAWPDRPAQTRKETLHHTARRVMHEVGRRTVLLPTTLVALGLLAHHRRGLHQEVLFARIRRFRDLFRRHQVPEASSLAHLESAVRLTLDRLARQRLVEHFTDDGERVWAVRVARRLELDFYKNQGMHVLAPAGLAAAAIRPHAAGPFRAVDLEDDHAFLVRLWRREFLFHPDQTSRDILRQGLEDLRAHGAVRATDTGLEVHHVERIAEIHALVRPFLEAYRIVARRARALDGGVQGRKEWVRGLQREEASLLASGLLTRPEALSLVTLENAVKVLVEDEALIQADDGDLSQGPADLEPLVSRLDRLVGA